jgi:hypothetical protein
MSYIYNPWSKKNINSNDTLNKEAAIMNSINGNKSDPTTTFNSQYNPFKSSMPSMSGVSSSMPSMPNFGWSGGRRYKRKSSRKSISKSISKRKTRKYT